MYRHRFLSDAQREAIETAHFDLDDREIARYWTLSDQDLLRIDRRRDSNRCGFAVQLCLLRFPGWPPQRETACHCRSCSTSASSCKSRPAISKSTSTVSPTQSEHLQEIIDLEHTVYFQKPIRAITEVGNPVPENVIPHLSPLGWEHITFTGSYHWREHVNVLLATSDLQAARQEKKNGVGILPRHQDHWLRRSP
jgi:hypothetical protein